MNEDYNSALTSSEYAIAINPDDANSLVSKANTLYTLENYDDALVYFKKYSEKKPDDEFGFYHQALCLVNKGKYEEGLELYKKAISIAPIDSIYLPEIYTEAAFAYSKIDNLDQALWCLSMTEQLDCDHANILVMKGHIFLTFKKDKEASDAFREALEKSNNSQKIQLQIIVSYQDNMHLNFAYKLFTEFFKHVDEKWIEGYAYMALCCNDLKKDDEFLRYLQKACECNPKEAKAVLNVLFPADMEPKDYYDYALEHLND
jgi:tetratricopeptide (TPR) repeat protein